MSIFLFLKQFVDMLYQFKVLDYGMVIFASMLLGKKVICEKRYVDIYQSVYLTDIIVVILSSLFIFSFLRDTSYYRNFFKVMSAFLVYFLGRAYGREILKHSRFLSTAAYMVIYANFIYRFFIFGGRLFVEKHSDLLNFGVFYYYKTDLAVGVITASIFVYIFGKNRVLKWFTLIIVTGYMIFYSGARMGMIALMLEYIWIAIMELSKRGKIRINKKEIWTKCAIIIIFSVVIGLFLVIQFWVKGNETFRPYLLDENGNIPLLEKLFHSRHVIWWEVSQYFSQQSFWIRLTGIDLGSEPVHNSASCEMHSMYFKLLYSVGYAGTILFASFISDVLYRMSKNKERELNYLVMAFLILFAVMGLTAQSLESTQMSWFMMIYAGAAITTGVKRNEETIYKPHIRRKCSRN